MRRWLAVLLTSFIPLCGCGSFFVGFAWNPSGTTSITGTVTIVSVQVLNRPPDTIVFTAVTLTNPGTTVTVTFCENQQDLFPLNMVIRVNFTNGSTCSTLTSVVVIGSNLSQVNFLSLVLI